MVKLRGLKTRPCPTCNKIEPHKTLYAKVESKGKPRWLRFFWACLGCQTLNHVVLPAYSLCSAPPELPSQLVTSVVDSLREKDLYFEELVHVLRMRPARANHIFDSDVAMALQYLTAQGMVAEQLEDLTDSTLAELRSRSAPSYHLGSCPAEEEKGVVSRSLIALYTQRRRMVEAGERGRTSQLRFEPVGVLCI